MRRSRTPDADVAFALSGIGGAITFGFDFAPETAVASEPKPKLSSTSDRDESDDSESEASLLELSALDDDDVDDDEDDDDEDDDDNVGDDSVDDDDIVDVLPARIFKSNWCCCIELLLLLPAVTL